MTDRSLNQEKPVNSPMNYQDTTLSVDDDSITIAKYGMFGSTRTIAFSDISQVTSSRIGTLGRWRLAGAGPGSGTRNWYGWDNRRRFKDTAYALDIGRFWRPTVTPDDPNAFRAALPPTLEVQEPLTG